MVGASAQPSGCGTSADLVPTCGILWGAHASAGVASLEQQIGREVAIVHDYTQWSGLFPTSLETSEAAAGRIIYVDWTARSYSTNQPAATWSQIASGAQDGQINAEAAALKAFGRPIMVSFQAEPEQSAYTTYGTSSDYVAAWRHIHDVFAADGVTNVVWVWDVEGDPTDHNYADWYPGDGYVDWIMWDPYNWYGCNGSAAVWKSFSQIVSPMYTWLTDNSGTAGNGDYLSKPWGLAEFGTVEGPTSTAKDEWFQEAVDDAQQIFPQLKALVYFDSTDTTHGRTCDWTVNSSSDALTGYATAGNGSYASAMLSPGATTTTTTTTTLPATTTTTTVPATTTTTVPATTTTTTTIPTTTTVPSSNAPTISLQPLSVSVPAGTRVTLSTAANGTPTPSATWQLSEDGGTTWYWLKQHTNPDYTIRSVTQAENGWEFRAVYSNSAGSATTAPATVTVTTTAANALPMITQQPRSVRVKFGSRVSLFAEASGRPRPRVTWQISFDSGRTWSTLSRQSRSRLTIPFVTPAVNDVEFRAIFRNRNGVTRSAPARITVP